MAVATVHHRGKEVIFQGLTGGEFADRLYHTIALMADAFATSTSNLHLRILESRAIHLVSVAAQSRNGRGSYAHVVDGTLLPKDSITIEHDISKLWSHAHDRLAMRHAKTDAILSPRPR